ncbi:hypothetical protein D6827_03755 [Candidatus Parcubacteria bacterium]|nr:MAG: hypothetical protein D6827_03755 [Candidatus Parcubacteria bacterium]
MQMQCKSNAKGVQRAYAKRCPTSTTTSTNNNKHTLINHKSVYTPTEETSDTQNFNQPENEKEKPEKKKRKQAPKTQFGEYGNVWLTEKEQKDFTELYGKEVLARAIEKLDCWIESNKTPQRIRNGKNAGATMRNWVFDSIAEAQAKAKRTNGNQLKTNTDYIKHTLNVIMNEEN